MPAIQKAPPDFDVDGERAIFVEFRSAVYNISLDTSHRQARVTSTITFDTPEGRAGRGRPLLDLSHSDDIVSVRLDGEAVGRRRVDAPDKITEYLALDRSVDRGQHVLELEHVLHLDQPDDDSVVIFFRMSHAKHFGHKPIDRLFLERYLPANLEFDAHPMTINLEFPDEPEGLRVFTNGEQTKGEGTQWQVEFPDYFTCSSPFFFLGRSERLRWREFEFPRPGRDPVHVTVFGHVSNEARLADYERQAREALATLAPLFGPLPHDRLHLYGARHGIEYAGAAEVAGSNVFHEMVHQYFGRHLMPADGNSGWIDEAIAHWAVAGFPRYGQRPDQRTDMGAVSPYRRATDKRARTVGPLLLGHLDHRMVEREGEEGGLKPFLRSLLGRGPRTITSREFQEELEAFAKTSFADEFDRHVYGTKPV